MLNLTSPSPKRGQYKLTKLGEKVIGEEKISIERVKCDVGEPCREACPTGTIGAFRLNLNCISCGLCVDVCPYGALELNCSSYPQLNFDSNICKLSKGKPKTAEICDFGKILGDELSLQRWIKQIMKIMGITSEIPGVGEYPDLVTLEEPAFIEVNTTRITVKKAKQLEEQIVRYAEQRIIKRTLEQLKRFSDQNWKYPDYLIIISLEGGDENQLVKVLQKEIADKTIGFIPLNRFYSNTRLNFQKCKSERESLFLSQLLQ